jgi:hypothetical protein
MSLKLRAGIAAVAAVALTLLAGPALASFAPKLLVSSNETTLTVNYSQGATDDPVVKLNLLVPNGYLANTGAPAGDKVGSVDGRATAGAVSGSLVAANATDPLTVGGAATTVAAALTTCTGPGMLVAAYWLANLTVGGTAVTVPVGYLTVLANRAFSDFAAAQIVLCPPASLGLSALNLTFPQIFSVAPGWYLWRVLATPSTSGAANAAATVETQSEDRVPQSVSLAVKKQGKALLAVGRLLQGGKGAAGLTVQVMAGTKVVASAKTTSGGSYRATLKLTTPTKLTATATVAERSLGGCQAQLNLAASCNGATVSGFTAKSPPVSAKP